MKQDNAGRGKSGSSLIYRMRSRKHTMLQQLHTEPIQSSYGTDLQSIHFQLDQEILQQKLDA